MHVWSAGSVAEASDGASVEGVRVLAGGTDILGTIHDYIHGSRPSALVSIKGLDLGHIREEGGGLAIGAVAKLCDIADSPLVRAGWGLLADAAKSVASPQIRHMATIGGNICQEPRCWYYRYPENRFDCLRKGGSVCPAFVGNNVYHSILGACRVGETGCRSSCPNTTDVAGHMELLRQGDVEGAARLLFSVNPLAAVTGRVCPSTCVSGCARAEFDGAVGIREVERFLGDYMLERADAFYRAPERESGRSVAVIGAGPAGLTAAFFLRAEGFAVTVFDLHGEAGGMLRYSIPAYRLPRGTVARIQAALEGMGVAFALGEGCDPGATAESYRRRFDAVFVGSGAQRPLAAGIEGEGHCLSGLDFLYRASVGEQGKPGDSVLVIGGGDVAMDVAVTAKRLGAKDVTVVYRRPRALMPAHEEELALALEEGVRIADSLAPVGAVVERGRLVGLDVAASRSGAGRDTKTEIDLGCRSTLAADCVIVAIGQTADLGLYGDALDTDGRKRLVTDGSLACSLGGVFAGGDAALGPATVIEAIAQARRAAASITAYLGGGAAARAPAPDGGEGGDRPCAFDPSALENSDAAVLRPIPPEERTLCGEDVAEGLDGDAVLREAARCFNCGCVAVSASDLAPALVALGATVRTNRRELPAARFFRTGLKSATALGAGEIVTEIFVPAPLEGAYMEYRKFRPRKAIDFPVLSVAVNIVRDGGIVKDAKIVLGAVRPTPFEATEAQDYLIGRPIDDETARAAAGLALRDAAPLAENAYKVSVARALVRRAVLAAGQDGGAA
jgi:NADPH-dependent glutamate synthase beta subunit-like oxidoreductase